METTKPKRVPIVVDATKVLLTEHTYGINHKLALHQKFADRYSNQVLFIINIKYYFRVFSLI